MNQNCNLSTDKIEDEEESDTEFTSSELGTKEHWDNTYKKELTNFKQTGDIGDIWFGEESLFRVINWITSSNFSHNCSIIDIGCGNGIMLSYLADEGFNNLYGIDYSDDAIALAKSVALKRETSVEFEVANITSRDCNKGKFLKKKFDIVHDKGTFDAISLCPNDAKTLMQNYMENVADILLEDGFYILTSCNWTEKELIPKFSFYFEKETTLPTPLFQFGGKIGSTITSLIMKKKPKIFT